MFKDILNSNQAFDRQPFFMKYYSYARLFVMLVLLDYIIATLLSVSFFIKLPAMLNFATNILYLILLIIFSSLLFYRFYNALFEKKILFAVNGIIMLCLGMTAMYLKRYTSSPLLQQFVYILFFLSLIFLYSIILLPVIKNKYINEFDRGLYIFLFLIVILPVVNAILKSVITAYPIISIESYFTKISSTSFLVFIFYYFSIVKNAIIKNIEISKKKLLIVLIILFVLFASCFYFKSDIIYTAIVAIYNNINVRMYLPFYIYMFAMAIFIISFIFGYFFTDKNTLFIPLTFILLTGLNTTDFYIRIVSVFAVIDIALYSSLIENSLIEKKQ